MRVCRARRARAAGHFVFESRVSREVAPVSGGTKLYRRSAPPERTLIPRLTRLDSSSGPRAAARSGEWSRYDGCGGCDRRYLFPERGRPAPAALLLRTAKQRADDPERLWAWRGRVLRQSCRPCRSCRSCRPVDCVLGNKWILYAGFRTEFPTTLRIHVTFPREYTTYK
jgi:hypothetical protein